MVRGLKLIQPPEIFGLKVLTGLATVQSASVLE